MKSTKRIIQKRLVYLLVSFITISVILSFRIAYIQIFKGEWLESEAQTLHTRDRLITPARGVIYDRNQNELTRNTSVATIGVVNAQIQDQDKVAKVLSKNLELDYDYVYDKITKTVALERIQTKVNKETADKIRSMNLSGVKVDEDIKRHYPYENILSHVIGFVGKDNQGIIGLEVKYDKYLKGDYGKILMETDGHGKRRKQISEKRIEPTPGNHLVTTLDINIQQYAEQALEKIIKSKNAEKGAIILMNPQDGAVYAMVNKPDFNLNKPFEINDDILTNKWHTYNNKEQNVMLNQMWRNFSINDTYEPGSTFKIITSAIGFEENIINEKTKFTCTGSRVVGGRRIKCWRSPRNHGTQTFVEGVHNSCNPVFMEIAEEIGAKPFTEYMKKFGFSEITNIDLPGEAPGIMHKLDNIGPVELATISFGQSFQITPMQLLRGASSVINGGRLVTPHIGDYIIDDNNNITEQFKYPIGKQVISEDNSNKMKSILQGVVEVGTGDKAYIPGYRVGGKTATSEKLPRNNGKYIASFLAFAPAEDPKIIGIVIVDEPEGSYYGGAVTGPVIQEVLQNTLPYLGISPVYSKEELEILSEDLIKVPSFKGISKDKAKELAYDKDLSIEIKGKNNKITNQFPKPGETVNLKSTIILYTD